MGAELTYSRSRYRWEGEEPATHRRLWLSDTTFQRHVWNYLASQQIYQPLLGDVDRAREHCRQLAYWQRCTDRAVHWIVPGGENSKDTESRT